MLKVAKYFLKIATFVARCFLKKRVARVVGKVAKSSINIAKLETLMEGQKALGFH